MIKGQANSWQFLLVDDFGYGRTGLSPTIKISKDGGSFAATTNSPTQVDSTNAPGLYKIALTATECNCDVLAFAILLPNGDMPAIVEGEELQTAAAVDPSTIWSYSNRTLSTNPPTVEQIQAGLATAEAVDKIHALLGSWAVNANSLTVTTSDGEESTYTITRNTRGQITAITPDTDTDTEENE